MSSWNAALPAHIPAKVEIQNVWDFGILGKRCFGISPYALSREQALCRNDASQSLESFTEILSAGRGIAGIRGSGAVMGHG